MTYKQKLMHLLEPENKITTQNIDVLLHLQYRSHANYIGTQQLQSYKREATKELLQTLAHLLSQPYIPQFST